MRIRKRAVPLPLSLLTPVPLSDLHHHHHHHLVQLQPTSDHDLPSNDLLHRPICHQQPPLRSINLKASEDEKIKTKEQRDESSMSSKQSESSAVTDNGVHQTRVFGTTDGRWCDGDKAIPLKKRKASLEMNGMVVTGESKMKSKTNKKCLVATTPDEDYDDDDDDDDDYEEDDKKSKKSRGVTKKNTRMKKKKKKGGSIMEGSRCSRVNGRGWRCMQATLVGYSLCEHHLGKGRLRSISSVRARSSSGKSTTPLISTSPEEKPCNTQLGIEEIIAEKQDWDDNQKKPISVSISGKKRMRIGMVKARSLSSLLCQPNTAVLHQIN